MEWLVRYFLRIPPDEADRRSAERLLDDLERTPDKHRRPYRLSPFLDPRYGPVSWYFDRNRFRESLREWLGSSDIAPAANKPPEATPVRCPLGREECPRNGPTHSTEDTAKNEATAESGIGEAIAELTKVGGKAVRRGAKTFLDLLDNSLHCKGSDIADLVMTDRYIYTSLGEDGRGEGYDTLIQILETLRLSRGSRFRLHLPQGGPAADAFKRRIESERTGVTVVTYSNIYIHDRFYLIKSHKEVNRKSKSGVFGPSLNSLDAGLYVMGDLDEPSVNTLWDALRLD